MLKVWHEDAWDEYLWWQEHDKKGLRRVNRLIRDLERSGGKDRPRGKAEVLKGSMSGLCSVRIDQSNRLVYKFDGDRLIILACRGHYV